jgi:hypothetical protein
MEEPLELLAVMGFAAVANGVESREKRESRITNLRMG